MLLNRQYDAADVLVVITVAHFAPCRMCKEPSAGWFDVGLATTPRYQEGWAACQFTFAVHFSCSRWRPFKHDGSLFGARADLTLAATKYQLFLVPSSFASLAKAFQ